MTTRQAILYNSNNLIISDKCYDGEEYIGSPKPREKMVGENLREGLMEVASEQWTERGESQNDEKDVDNSSVDFNVIPYVTGSSI